MQCISRCRYKAGSLKGFSTIVREALRRQWGTLEMRYMDTDQLSVTIRSAMNLTKKGKALEHVKECDGDVQGDATDSAVDETGPEGKGAGRAEDLAAVEIAYATTITPPEMLHTDLQRLISFLEMRSPRILAVVLKILACFAADDFDLRVVIERFVVTVARLFDFCAYQTQTFLYTNRRRLCAREDRIIGVLTAEDEDFKPVVSETGAIELDDQFSAFAQRRLSRILLLALDLWNEGSSAR